MLKLLAILVISSIVCGITMVSCAAKEEPIVEDEGIMETERYGVLEKSILPNDQNDSSYQLIFNYRCDSTIAELGGRIICVDTLEIEERYFSGFKDSIGLDYYYTFLMDSLDRKHLKNILRSHR